MSASASTVSIHVPDSFTLPLLCLWLCLSCPLLCLCLLYTWFRSSVCVCDYYVSVLVLGLSAPPSASAVSFALSKALKRELINVAFLDSIGNHVQSASFFRSIARSIVRPIACFIAGPIAFPKIYGLYRVPGLGARIFGVKYWKSYDNTPSQDNLNTRAAIYIVWRCLVLGLWYQEHSDA